VPKKEERKPNKEERKAQEAEKVTHEQLEQDFKTHWKNYVKRSMEINWKTVPGVVVPTGRDMMWKDLWSTNMGYVMREYFFKDKDRETKYGHIPKMAVASRGMMGATMASSFCERINSCANLVCTKGNSMLSDDEIDKVVTLRMNREFMEFMRRANYPEVIKSLFPKYGTLFTADDVREEREKEEA
jgi:hypothetical protein